MNQIVDILQGQKTWGSIYDTVVIFTMIGITAVTLFIQKLSPTWEPSILTCSSVSKAPSRRNPRLVHVCVKKPFFISIMYFCHLGKILYELIPPKHICPKLNYQLILPISTLSGPPFKEGMISSTDLFSPAVEVTR